MASEHPASKDKVGEPRSAGAKPRLSATLIPALVPLILSVSLLVLGLPRLVSTVILLPTEPVLEVLRMGGPVGAAELDRLSWRASAARQFSAAAGPATVLAAAKLAQADRLPRRAYSERRILAGEAAALLESALATAPADGFAWAQLAYARALKDGLGPGVVNGWRMSVLTAPAERRLVLWRIRFGIPLISRFTDSDRSLLDRQIRLAWHTDEAGLTNYASQAGPMAIETIRAALLGEPAEALQRFDTLMRQSSELR